jgi:hypothetical protein
MVARIDGVAAAAQAEAIGKQLDDLIKAGEDLRPIWPEVGQVFAERQNKIFRTGSNGRWAPLATGTLIKKAKTSISPSSILVETGLLRDAATSPQARKSAELSAEWGVPSGDPVRAYTQYHVRGSGVPQRQPVPKMTPAERRDMIVIIRRRLQKVIEQ